MGAKANLIHAIDGNALLEVADKAITTGVFLGVHALVDIQIAIVVVTLRILLLRLAAEVVLEMPVVHRALPLRCENLLNDHVRGVEILVEQVARCLEHVAEILHVLRRLVAWKSGRRIEGRHVQAKQVTDRVDVLAPVQATQDGASAGAYQGLAAFPERLSGPLDKRFYFRSGGLLCGLGGHRAEMDLIQHILEDDEGVDSRYR